MGCPRCWYALCATDIVYSTSSKPRCLHRSLQPSVQAPWLYYHYTYEERGNMSCEWLRRDAVCGSSSLALCEVVYNWNTRASGGAQKTFSRVHSQDSAAADARVFWMFLCRETAPLYTRTPKNGDMVREVLVNWLCHAPPLRNHVQSTVHAPKYGKRGYELCVAAT